MDGIELSRDVRNIAAIRREIGMVFQQFNLFPHLTVLENITLGAHPGARLDAGAGGGRGAASCWSAWASRSRRAKYPAQLSGGQQQRVAIARALAMQPRDHAVRRADLGARPGDDQRGPGRDAGAGRARA